MKWRNILEGVGLGILLMLRGVSKILSPSHLAILFHRLPVTTIFGALLVDLLIVSMLGVLFFAVFDRLPLGVRPISNSLLTGSILFCGYIVVVSEFQTWEHIHWKAVGATFLLASLVLAWKVRHIAVVSSKILRLLLGGLAFSSLWIVPQLARVALTNQTREDLSFSHPTQVPANTTPRIIWILFDELSYRQVFERGAEGVDLPGFSGFVAHSVSFSHLRPAGYFTQNVIPTLLLGQRIRDIRGTINGEMLYMDEVQNQWRDYDPQRTLIGQAKQGGWNPAIAGFLLPYCRIFSALLSSCTWSPQPFGIEVEAGCLSRGALLSDATLLPKAMLGRLMRTTQMGKYWNAIALQKILPAANGIIRDENIRFAFLHFPVPHPPGIYDRRTHRRRDGGTYLDNLVLADDTLTALLREIHATRSASQTTVIVSSDHSWRINEWDSQSDWSSEEQSATGGRFDDRPVLLVSFPGQTSSEQISDSLPALLEHDMISAMLMGEMKNMNDVAAFIKSRR